ncbi:MAG: SAM-dependent methyltransferase [Candidatus Woesearchaeota archaeon]
MKYIIEHLENGLPKWCYLEYVNISKIVGRDNLIFTNIRRKFFEKLKDYGTVMEKSVSELNLKRVCVLDPEAKKRLDCKDSKKFDYFVFGGILGDFPAKKRTQKLLSSKFCCKTRNLGKKQMPTDTAVKVAKLILEGRKFEELKFKDRIILKIRKNEEVILPFRFLLGKDGNPEITPGVVDYLKNKKEF